MLTGWNFLAHGKSNIDDKYSTQFHIMRVYLFIQNVTSCHTPS